MHATKVLLLLMSALVALLISCHAEDTDVCDSCKSNIATWTVRSRQKVVGIKEAMELTCSGQPLVIRDLCLAKGRQASIQLVSSG